MHSRARQSGCIPIIQCWEYERETKSEPVIDAGFRNPLHLHRKYSSCLGGLNEAVQVSTEQLSVFSFKTNRM